MNIPNNINDFNEQAKSFVAKAKEAGKSNTAIANTIRFMFEMYQQQQAEITDQPDENWQYRDKDGDGIDDVMYNAKTGEERPIDYGYGNTGLGDLESGYGEEYASNMPSQTGMPRSALTAPGVSGYDAGRSTEMGEQVWSSSELERLENEQDFSIPMSIAPTPEMSIAPTPEMSINKSMNINEFMTPDTNVLSNYPTPGITPTQKLI